MSIYKLVFCLSFASCLFLEIWIFFRERKDVDRSKDGNTRIIFAFTVFMAIILGYLASKIIYFRIAINTDMLFLTAAAVIWLGILLRFWSVITLGKFFRTTVMIQNGHRVIKTGPYRYMRHPSYTADLIILMGIAIGLGNWLSLILMECLLFYFAIRKRIKLEEKELKLALGTKYSDYIKNTKGLIPFIY